MGHPAIRHTSRAYLRRSAWRTPKEGKLRLVPPRDPQEGWGEVIGAEPPCEARSTEISEGYKSAIALLRSLRNVKPEEIEKKRESYDLLVQVMDEDRYH